MDEVVQSLLYPLDVYAALMRRVCGEVPYLCYGLQDAPLDSDDSNNADAGPALLAAQHKLVDSLIDRIDHAAPATVLDIGCGFGTLAERLHGLGYKVTGVDASAPLIAQAQARWQAQSQASNRVENQANTQAPATPQRWLNATIADLPQTLTSSGGPERFAVIILQASARYESWLTVLGVCTRLLAPGGQLLVVDEFSTAPRDSHQPAELPVLHHVLALAERTGLSLDTDQDLSAATARFIQTFLHQYETHSAELPALTGRDPATVADLRRALVSHLSQLQAGEYSHRLLCWRLPADVALANGVAHAKNQAPAVNIWPASLLPAEQYREVFESSFGVTFDTTLWQWKYGEGRSASVVAVRDDEAVAHYGGIRREIDYFGTPTYAVQICDVMVKPQERSFFSRRGLFFKTATAMVEQSVGFHAHQLLGFGFPNLKHLHVGARLGLYDTTDEILSISLVAQTAADPRWRVQPQPLDAVPADLLDQWWADMRRDFSDAIIGHRHPEYLYYRYLARPGLQYRALVVQCDDKPVGLAIVRDHGDCDLLMDLICAEHRLADAFRAVAAASRANGRLLRFWMAAGQLAQLQGSAATDLCVDHIDVFLPCIVWTAGPSAESLKGAWWVTAGDTDFL